MGPVVHEKNEPVFHAPWEGRVYALNRAVRAWRKWSLDTDRHALELMSPIDYLRMGYYERGVYRPRGAVVQDCSVSREEIESGQPAPGSTKASPPLALATSDHWLD